MASLCVIPIGLLLDREWKLVQQIWFVLINKLIEHHRQMLLDWVQRVWHGDIIFVKLGLNQGLVRCGKLIIQTMIKKLNVLNNLLQPCLMHCSQSETLCRLCSISLIFCTNKIYCANFCSEATSLAIDQSGWHKKLLSQSQKRLSHKFIIIYFIPITL